MVLTMLDAEHPPKIQKKVSKDIISSLSDDLLLQILSHLPTKNAVSTMFLSKRWRFVWTMLPELFYRDTKYQESKSVWLFHDESMRFHNAPVLQHLCIQLGPQCPVDADVVKWVTKAVDRRLSCLLFKLFWNNEPTRMPNSLYTCKTLATLTLSHKILVDVPSSASLPSLTQLDLLSLLYKDEDSHVSLLSSCPVLKSLYVERRDEMDDNVKKFIVKVPSLKILTYANRVIQNEEADTDEEEEYDPNKSLVIDTPGLVYLDIDDILGQSCSIKYMPHLVEASIVVVFDPNGNLLRSLSSIKHMSLYLVDTIVMWWNSVTYSLLRECSITLLDPLCDSLVVLLSNCPKLEAFMVEYSFDDEFLSWNNPSYVPKCLSSTLKTFEWGEYMGREDEKGFIRYIKEKSKCLTTFKISPYAACDPEEKLKMMKEFNIQD